MTSSWSKIYWGRIRNMFL